MKRLLIICFIPFIFYSCGDNFLNLYPEDKSTEGNYWETETHFEQALNGAYSSLRSIYGTAVMGYLMMEMRADNTHYTYYSIDRGEHLQYRENIADFLVTEQNQWVGRMWEELYKGIGRTNAVIDRINDATLPEDFANGIIGQAKFLRAFYYFHLVQLYGGVPLQLTEIKKSEDAFIPRASVEEVYTSVIKDVTDAINLLPVVNEKLPRSGRATKGAAQMLYAYVLMTKPNRDYKEAEAQLKNILGMNYALEADYAEIFNPVNKNGTESIFEVQYLEGDIGLENGIIYHFLPKSLSSVLATGISIGFGNNSDRGGWNIPTQAFIELFDTKDKRLNASVSMAVGHREVDSELLIYEDVLNVGDPDIANYQIVIPFINKYRHPHAKEFNTNDNWPVFRLADTYLLLSECLIEQGNAGEALSYVNKVRERAGLDPLTNISADLLMHERRLELAFENHRWYDLLRTGKALSTMAEYGKYIKSVDPNVTERAYQVKEEYLLFPIPYRERYTNTNLVQNPGY
jgi:hypothetical protein